MERPTPRALAEEVERLRLRLEQREHALACLADAVVALRRANEAHRAENRELLLELEAERRRKHAA